MENGELRKEKLEEIMQRLASGFYQRNDVMLQTAENLLESHPLYFESEDTPAPATEAD